MNLFYAPDITNSKTYVLSETESKHAIRVLRLIKGDEITLIDGKGNFYTTQITDDNAKKCIVEIIDIVKEKKHQPFIHIAIAPTKNNDRMEWFVEKCTEIGISEITPLLCSNSERKKIKSERLIKTAISAMKQSLKATLPQINELTTFKDLIATSFDGEKLIAHCYEDEKSPLKNSYEKKKNVLILIGPEGDFSKEEIELAIQHNFEPITLGESRLRTETAGILACHTIHLMNE